MEKMTEDERESVLQRYIDNPLFDDTDLYYNGLCHSSEFLDHKPDLSYKNEVARIIRSWPILKPEEPEKEQEVNKAPPPTHLMTEKQSRPLILRIKRSKTSCVDIIDPTQNPTAVIETHNSPSSTNTSKPVEVLPSSQEAPNQKSFRHTLGESTAFSIDKSEKPLQNKRSHTQDEDDGPINKKLVEIQEFQEPEEPLMENIPAILKARLQKNNAVLVIKKELTNSDVDPSKGRLSIPENQTRNRNFLTEEEFTKVTHGTKVEAKLIDPSGDEYNIRLTRWKMTRCWTYNLVSPWNKVVEKNNLQWLTPIELYSFREGPQLYFALIKHQP